MEIAMDCATDEKLKKCFKCGLVKPLSEFYEHPMMGDGHLGKCKLCTRLDVRANHRARHEQYRAYDRIRYEANPARRKILERRSLKKRMATQAVYRATKSGKLVRGVCAICGAEKVDAHHEDYDKQLEVVWLCRKHHMRLHNNDFCLWPEHSPVLMRDELNERGE